MNAPSFAPILDRKPSEVERPKQIVVGSYVWLTKGVPRFDKSTQKKTDFVEFTVVPQGPVKNEEGENLDVDQEALDAVLTRSNGEKIAIQSKSQRLTFYITEDAVWRLKEFLRHLGFDIPEEGEEEPEDAPSLRQMINESANRRFGGYVSHKPSEDGQTMYANITKTFALEE